MNLNIADKINRVFGIKKDRSVKKNIRNAAENKNVARVRYQKKGGKTKIYKVEPYSYRRRNRKKYLFGHDREDDKIKMFLLKNIKSVAITDQEFEPRYPVEIGKTAGFLYEIKKHGMDSINPLISVSKGPAKHTSSIFGPQSKDRLMLTPKGVRSTGKAHKGLKHFMKTRKQIMKKMTGKIDKIPQ